MEWQPQYTASGVSSVTRCHLWQEESSGPKQLLEINPAHTEYPENKTIGVIHSIFALFRDAQ